MGERSKKDSDSWQELYDQLEKAVVGADHEQSRKLLNHLRPAKIPRTWSVKFAEMAVRSHFPMFALKALNHFVYPVNTLAGPPTDKERMIYARSLYHLGATAEAVDILNAIDLKAEPEALFHRACANMFQWNYQAAVTDLRLFVQQKQISPYRRLVGKVNLAASLIHIFDWISAEPILEEVRVECEAGSHKLLLGNYYELKAQCEIFQTRYDSAFQYLEKAGDILKNQGGLYALYVEKWIAVSHCLKSRSVEDVKKLEAVRKKALELSHWGTVRECDLFEAIVTKNEDLIRKLIMGTPVETYRLRARRLFETDILSRGKYHWKLGDSQSELIFDPYNKNGKTSALYEKPLLMGLFDALSEDFYQPSNLGMLFKKIYPEEKFNPFTSPARVLQLLKRLNIWFEENQTPLRVDFKKSEFSLTSLESITVVIYRGKDLSSLSSEDRKFSELRTHFHERTITVPHVSKVMEISETSARRMLLKGLKEGKVTKQGQGRNTVYKLVSQRQKKAA